HGERRYVLHFAGDAVVARNLGAASAIDDVRMQRIGRRVAVLNDAGGVPVAKGDLAVVAACGDADGAALLLAATDLIREGVRRRDVVDLRGRLVVPGTPAFAAIDADHRALIADQQQDLRIARVDPEV